MQGITFSGFNGIDFGRIIDLTMQFERQPVDRMIGQQDSYRQRDAALSSLSSLISKMQTTTETINGASIYTNLAATSSDATVATAAVGSSGLSGAYTVVVSDIARAQTTVSTSGYANTTDTAATGGSLSFTIGSTTTTAIDISAATTLEDLRDAINNQGSGVVASIVNNGTDNRLVLTSRETGTTNGFTVNNSLTNASGTAVTFAVGQNSTTGNAQNATNASVTINGLAITSASNQIVNGIPGTTLNIFKAGTTNVSLSADHASLKNAITSFVSDFNKVKDFVAQQQTKNALTGRQGVLASDSLLRQVYSDLRSTITGANTNGGAYDYLSEIGIELTSTGELKVDDAKLTEAINSNYADVKLLLQGSTGVDGVFDNLKSRLVGLDGSTGTIKAAKDSIKVTIEGFTDRIAAAEARLELRRSTLVKIYGETERIMSQFSQQGGSLSSLTRTFSTNG